MIRALLFDFNGVVVDDETLHFELFQKVLQENSYTLKQEDYYQKYLGMDDYDCFGHALKDQGVQLSREDLQKLIDQKSSYYNRAIEKDPPFVPGVLDWIAEVSKTHFLAVVSGALRQEIEDLLERGKVAKYFSLIVAAGEISQGKPHPEGYLKAMEELNRDHIAASERLLPEECLVLEDSSWGIQAGQAAGMPVVGITTSYEPDELPGALVYLKDFTQMTSEQLLRQVETQ